MKKNYPLISIVIPMFNVEKYILKCIESINSQTFKDYEVIFVDDGSKDNTLKILQEHKNEKFKIISQKNMGAGMARNHGIEEATGEYITFMDSDDFFYDEYCLEKIVNIIRQENCDVVTYKMVRYYQNKNKFFIEPDIITKNNRYENILDYLKDTIELSRLSVSPCDKIIKTEIIKKNNVFFNNLAMLEDVDWSLNLFKYVNSIYIYNEPIYVYRKQRTDSTTSSYTVKKIAACSDFIYNWCSLYKKNSGIYYELCLHYIAYQYTILLAAINKKNSSKENRKRIKEYHWLLNYDLNFKTKKSKLIYKIFGFNIMVVFLKTYMFLKNKNLILIR